MWFYDCYAWEEILCKIILENPELDAVLQMKPHQCQVERKDHFPWPAGNALPNTTRILLQTCCGCTLPHHSRLQWRCLTVLTPGVLLPDGLWSTDHKPLGLVVQLVFTWPRRTFWNWRGIGQGTVGSCYLRVEGIQNAKAFSFFFREAFFFNKMTCPEEYNNT